jgi:hypothetical protein
VKRWGSIAGSILVCLFFVWIGCAFVYNLVRDILKQPRSFLFMVLMLLTTGISVYFMMRERERFTIVRLERSKWLVFRLAVPGWLPAVVFFVLPFAIVLLLVMMHGTICPAYDSIAGCFDAKIKSVRQ